MTLNLKLITASNLEFEVLTDKDYNYLELVVLVDGVEIRLDRLEVQTGKSDTGILLKKDKNIYEVDLNLVEFEYIYYKDFQFILYKDEEVVEKSKSFKMEPKGRKDLYGIISKLIYDFNRLWTISGTECALFIREPLAQKCPYCWDKDLKQYISSKCTHCNGSGVLSAYKPIYFKARRVRTETQQFVNEKGVNIINLAIYTTFARLNFTLESIIFDLTTREFFEIKNANIASIGGVRTSTQITAQFVPSNDARVKPLLPLLK